MSKLKIEFQKPKLTLCNTNYIPLGILTNKTNASARNITLTSKVNETPSLSFDIPLGGLIDNNSTELLVKHKSRSASSFVQIFSSLKLVTILAPTG